MEARVLLLVCEVIADWTVDVRVSIAIGKWTEHYCPIMIAQSVYTACQYYSESQIYWLQWKNPPCHR